MDAFYFFLLSMGLLFLFSLTGKIGIGFQIPGIARPLDYRYRKILNRYFSYYHLLNSKEQKLFKQKLQYFIHIKQFIARDIKMTDEMKVLISACAVQLTFGFPKVMLSHFKRILIYPNDYYVTINRKYHKGAVKSRLQAIVLSWKNFVQRYIEDNNGKNLGLHDMTHALQLENRIFNKKAGFLDNNTLDQWHQLAGKEIEKIRMGQSTMFRNYGGTNQDGFFSIAVENFFEHPQKFNKLMPELFKLMTKLLRQNLLKN